MLRKIGCRLLCVGALISIPAFAMADTFVPNILIEYELLPKEPLTLSNYLFWPVTATCTISTIDLSDDVFIEVLNKKGSINGIEMKAKESTSLTVHMGYRLTISAESGARVRLTNQGQHPVLANCIA